MADTAAHCAAYCTYTVRIRPLSQKYIYPALGHEGRTVSDAGTECGTEHSGYRTYSVQYNKW